MRLARGLAGSAADGDDLLQEALVRAWRAWPGLRERDRFRPWLLTIVGNVFRSWARRRSLKRWLGLDRIRRMPAPPEPECEEKLAVRQALQALPPVQREAIVLAEIVGLSQAEVAEIQKVGLSAVKTRLARGRIRLRDRYEVITRAEVRHVPTKSP